MKDKEASVQKVLNFFFKTHKDCLNSVVWGTMTELSINRQTEMNCYNAIISIYNISCALDK